MRTKFIDITIGVVFLYFAIIQWNDPDAWIWMTVYGLVVLMAALKLLGVKNQKVFKGIFIFLFFWFLVKFPTLLEWFQAGMPNFLVEQPTNVQILEKMREFLGALIGVGAAFFLLKGST